MHLNKQSKTAILIFAYSAEEEIKYKPIENGQKLFDTLTGQTLNKVGKSKLPYFHYSEKHQIGNTFGERFANAIQAIFDKGYENIITIGNDSPQLKTEHLLKACQEIQDNKVVFGPSIDGGFYLMGISKRLFNSSQFKDLPWQTQRIRNTILEIEAIQKCDVCYLPTFIDVDSLQDVTSLLNYISCLSKEVLVIFLLILHSGKEAIKDFLLYYIYFNYSVQFNKGSPQYIRQIRTH